MEDVCDIQEYDLNSTKAIARKNDSNWESPGDEFVLSSVVSRGWSWKWQNYWFCDAEIPYELMTSKNTTQEMTTAIWRISAGLNIPLYPEFAEEQANEGRKPLKMNNICCSKDLITHVHINNERAVNNKNKVPEI